MFTFTIIRTQTHTRDGIPLSRPIATIRADSKEEAVRKFLDLSGCTTGKHVRYFARGQE